MDRLYTVTIVLSVTVWPQFAMQTSTGIPPSKSCFHTKRMLLEAQEECPNENKACKQIHLDVSVMHKLINDV